MKAAPPPPGHEHEVIAARGEDTRRRLVRVALALFAERGYEGVSVGDIEEAAGLAPRSGALYKHFASKRALLEVVLGERMEAIESIERRVALLPLDDVGSELTLIAHLGLDELERERELVKVVMKDGDRFPGIAASFHERIVARGHELARAWLRARAELVREDVEDLDALADVLVEGLVGYALQSFIFGSERRVVDRARFIAAWVELGRSLLDRGPEEAA